MKELKVRITFTEEVLGSQCADKEIHRTYIASKAPDAPSREDEVATLGVDAVEEKSMTIFHKYEDGKPFVYDYQVKGMFKDSCGMLRKVKGSESSKIKAYKKEIDGLIFVKERKIPLIFDGDMGTCQRPLRANTPQGERISLACSETVPAGTTMEFTVQCMVDSHVKVIKEWLDYGELRGFSQWRNSGKGRYVWDELDKNGNIIGGNNVHKKVKKTGTKGSKKA